MFENQEKYEEIENKVIFLNSQLRIRDDEIKQVTKIFFFCF